MKHIYFLSILFFMTLSHQSLAGSKFNISIEDESGYKLYFHDTKEKCMNNVTPQFKSTYLDKYNSGFYELETNNSDECSSSNENSYSFQVDIIVDIDDGGKTSTEKINIFTLSGTSSGFHKFAYISDKKDDMLNKYNLCIKSDETYFFTQTPTHWFNLIKGACKSINEDGFNFWSFD